MSHTATLAFGPLLKHLRKQAGMTQRDLAAALGYSESLICSLEKAQRLPDLQAVTARFIPALGLQDDPNMAATLIEQAALARGERPPTAVTFQRTTQLSIQDSLAEPVHALPFPPTELIGRDAAINQLCNRLLGHGGRLLTLLGPPGIGKTTLALAVAAHLQNHYQDGAVFVPLAAISEPTLMASTILTAVGSTDLNPPQNKLIAFLRRKTMLLVLDNLEQLLPPPLSGEGPKGRPGVGLIAALVAACPGLCILTTSRERLHLRAEQRFKVSLLELAPAVDLFVQRAQAVDSDFALTAHNQPILEAICQRLDCLPLALELCAAQIDLLSPVQLLAQLQARRLDLLVDGAHDLPPRQRTLRSAIGYSYALLNEVERLFFRGLGVFAGGFTLDTVEVLLADRLEPVAVQATLHALIGKSLVRAETLPNGEQRFLLLETIREFALEQAHIQGEKALLCQRHYATYLQRFRTADDHSRGAEAAIWVARMEPDQDNLRAALQWALDEARYTDAAWLMVAVHYFWHLRGYRYEESRWVTQLLPYRHQLATDLRLVILNNFYGAALGLEEFPPVDCYRDEIMQLLEDCSDPCLRSAAWYFFLFAADYAYTAAAMARSVAWARAAYVSPGLGAEFGAAADRDYILGANLWGYAKFLIDQGQLAQAKPIATEGLHLFRRLGNPIGIGDGLANLGRLALLQGDLVQAHQFFHEAVVIATTVRNHSMQCAAQMHLGVITLYGGDTAEAIRLLSECLRFGLALQDKVFLARNYAYLAETALWEGKVDQADRWLIQSLAYPADAQRNRTGTVVRLFIAARVATAQAQYRRAATLFGLADQVHNQIEYVIAGPIRTLAEVALVKVREALDPVVFAEAFAAGQHLSLEAAFATILAPAYSAGTPLRI